MLLDRGSAHAQGAKKLGTAHAAMAAGKPRRLRFNLVVEINPVKQDLLKIPKCRNYAFLCIFGSILPTLRNRQY
ncbi:hypothetical protein AB4144_66135, partial [Rhizobiaceae sp. 2RAB30]